MDEAQRQDEAPRQDDVQRLHSLKNITTVVYALQAAAFLVGLSWIVAVVVNYVKREEVAGTWLESHFNWQIRTFWWGLLWGVLGCVLALVVVGFAILFADAVWIIYRIVKGWLALNDDKPVPYPLENRASSG